MIHHRLSRILSFFFTVQLLALSAATPAQTLPFAESQTAVNCSGVIDGTNVLVPGFTSANCTFLSLDGTLGSDAQSSTSGWLSGTGAPGDPLRVGRAEASGVNTGSLGGNMSGGAQLLFYFDLVSIGQALPPPGTVTIKVEYKGSGAATGTSGQYYVEARSTWGIGGSLTNEAISTTFSPSGAPFNEFHTIQFMDDPGAGITPLDWSARIWLIASCSAGGGPGATCNAFADPIFTFADPTHAEHYAFNFSPNISIIPVPAAAWLFYSGMVLIIGVARRRTR